MLRAPGGSLAFHIVSTHCHHMVRTWLAVLGPSPRIPHGLVGCTPGSLGIPAKIQAPGIPGEQALDGCSAGFGRSAAPGLSVTLNGSPSRLTGPLPGRLLIGSGSSWRSILFQALSAERVVVVAPTSRWPPSATNLIRSTSSKHLGTYAAPNLPIYRRSTSAGAA